MKMPGKKKKIGGFGGGGRIASLKAEKERKLRRKRRYNF